MGIFFLHCPPKPLHQSLRTITVTLSFVPSISYLGPWRGLSPEEHTALLSGLGSRKGLRVDADGGLTEE